MSTSLVRTGLKPADLPNWQPDRGLEGDGQSAFDASAGLRVPMTVLASAAGASVTPDFRNGGSNAVIMISMGGNVVLNPPAGYSASSSTPEFFEATLVFIQSIAPYTGTLTISGGYVIDGVAPQVPQGSGAMLVQKIWTADSGATWHMQADGAPEYTWVTKPSAIGRRGQEIYISNFGVGGSWWVSDGARWRPRTGTVTMFQRNGRGAAISGVTEVIDATVLIPGAAVVPGDYFELTYGLEKSGTADTATHRIRAGTTGTTADTQIFTSNQPATTNRSQGGKLEIQVASLTSLRMRGSGNSVSPFSASNANASPTAVTVPDMTNNWYLSFSELISAGTGGETVQSTDMTIRLVAAGA